MVWGLETVCSTSLTTRLHCPTYNLPYNTTPLSNIQPPLQHDSTVRHTTSLTTRLHCPTYNLPYNTTPLSDIQQFVQFVLRYAEENAILLLGCIPGYKCDDIQLLPSSTTKHNLWELYHRTALESEGARAVCYSLFCQLWQQLSLHRSS